MLGQISYAITTRQQSEARFRTLVEQAVDAFFVVDQQGQIIDVNQTACHDLGYSRDELLRLTVPDIQKAFTAADFEKIWPQLQPGRLTTITSSVHQGTVVTVTLPLAGPGKDGLAKV